MLCLFVCLLHCRKSVKRVVRLTMEALFVVWLFLYLSVLVCPILSLCLGPAISTHPCTILDSIRSYVYQRHIYLYSIGTPRQANPRRLDARPCHVECPRTSHPQICQATTVASPSGQYEQSVFSHTAYDRPARGRRFLDSIVVDLCLGPIAGQYGQQTESPLFAVWQKEQPRQQLRCRIGFLQGIASPLVFATQKQEQIQEQHEQ